MTHYRHTQNAWWAYAIMFGFALYSIGVAVFFGPSYSLFWILTATGVFFVALGTLFSRLTVEVTETEIRVAFGIGLIRRTIPLSNVASCEPVRNKWYYGWGIRYIGKGWMWNVTGLDAVELQYQSGSAFRIGTDEPRKLAQAINLRLEELKG